MRAEPELVSKLVIIHDAWVVGSAADPNNKEPRDWDVIVPYSKWNAACQLIPKDAKVNSFGGFKCISEGKEVDVWPDELGNVMQCQKAKFAWHPRSGIRLTKE